MLLLLLPCFLVFVCLAFLLVGWILFLRNRILRLLLCSRFCRSLKILLLLVLLVCILLFLLHLHFLVLLRFLFLALLLRIVVLGRLLLGVVLIRSFVWNCLVVLVLFFQIRLIVCKIRFLLVYICVFFLLLCSFWICLGLVVLHIRLFLCLTWILDLGLCL